VADLEADPSMAPRLEDARRALSGILDTTNTLRRLRLAAGFSQASLAAAAKTTQTYIARVEAGTLDPGTDMLARLAGALGTDEVIVFSAVRAQRAKKGLTGFG
jgi:transcriptional regulator with XRE-family HTH domain